MPDCPLCRDQKWIHLREPFEIRGCSCWRMVHESEAILQHRIDHPNCEWPDYDIWAGFRRQLDFLKNEPISDELKAKVQDILTSVESKLSFPAMLEKLVIKLGEIIDEMNDALKASSTLMAWRHLEEAIAFVVQSIYRLRAGKWTLGHALCPDDGDFQEDGQWRVRKLAQDQ